MGRVIGIDLGTTNSCMAVLEGGEPTVLENTEGGRTTPSVVAFAKDGQRLVGTPAKRQAVTNPENTIFSIKRFMGRKSAEVSEEMTIVPYRVVSGPNGDARVEADGKQYAPPEISAMILQKLKADAEAKLGESRHRRRHHRAGVLQRRPAPGHQGRRPHRRPERPAHHQRADRGRAGLRPRQGGRAQTILVFDLGGGTFDVSVLELADGVFEVKSTSGDNHLGGDNFDKAIVDWMVGRVQARQRHRPLGRPARAAAPLRGCGEGQDRALLDPVDADQPAVRDGRRVRAEAPRPVALARQADRAVRRARSTAPSARPSRRSRTPACRPRRSATSILVGGMTRMPAVQDKVRELVGKEPHRGVNPDEVVAVGAAIQGGVLRGEVKDVLLLDVTPLSLGIETKGGVMTKLIERNTTIPTRKSEVFSTADDGQTSVEIHVLQGEREMAQYNKTLGKFQLDGHPARAARRAADRGHLRHRRQRHPAGVGEGPRHGQRAADPHRGRLRPERGRDPADGARTPSRTPTRTAPRKELADAKNEAESTDLRRPKSLSEHGDKVDAETREGIESAIADVRSAARGRRRRRPSRPRRRRFARPRTSSPR